MTIKDISPEELLALWKKGKSLWKAFSEFCDQKYIDEYNKINSDQKSDNKLPPQGILEALNQISQEWQKSTIKSTNTEKAKNNLKNNLFEKISQKKLIALGFKSPINSDFPTLIPEYMYLPENTDINKSSISAHGIDFVQVRIIKANLLNKAKSEKQKLPEIKIESKKTGRPTNKQRIQNAYLKLIEKGKIDYSLPFSNYYGLIRETVLVLYPELKNKKGLQDEAIRRHTKTLLDTDKNLKK